MHLQPRHSEETLLPTQEVPLPVQKIGQMSDFESSNQLITEPDLHPSPPNQGQKPSRARRLWRRAYLKIKGEKAVEKINANILNYGTSELMDGDKRYKANLDELLTLKLNKKERFRSADHEKRTTWTRKRWLFYPNSTFRQYWNLVITGLMLYVAIVAPYRLAFMEDVYFDAWTVFDLILNFLFCIDIIINFFTCDELPDGTIEDRQSQIAIRYLKKWFLIDLISSLPFNLLDFAFETDQNRSGNLNSVMRLARLPRLYRLFRLAKIFKAIGHYSQMQYTERLQGLFHVNSRIVKLMKFLTIVCFCVHLMGCIWFFTARVMEFEPDTWVVRCGYIESPEYEQYLAGVYWAVTTMVTVGYGDIAAKTWLEIICAIIWMFVGVGFYSFTVGSLSSFLTSVDTKESLLTAKMTALHEFAKETNISHAARVKVRDAVRYYNWKAGSVWTNKHSLFNDIPRSLQYEVSLSMYNGILKDLQFFSHKPPSFVLYFLPLFKPLSHLNATYLYKEGEFADEMYFICKGRVNLVLFPHEIAYKSYLRGSYIGEIEIVKQIRRIDNAQVCGNSEFLSISRSDLRGAMREFPVEAKEIAELAHERCKKHTQSRLETIELLKLKKEKGNLQDLAGREKKSCAKDSVEEEITAVDCMKRSLSHRILTMEQEMTTVQEEVNAVKEGLSNFQRELGALAGRIFDNS